METKKKSHFLIVLILIFIVFLCLYLAQINGYNEFKQYNKMIITKEAMEQFENDISKGKDITIEEYITNTYYDYSNGISKLGLKTGKFMESIVTKGINRSVKILKTLFTN